MRRISIEANKGATTMPVYNFIESNSGGSWRLSQEDYDALIASGEWHLDEEISVLIDTIRHSFHDDPTYRYRKSMVGEFPTIAAAVGSWERITGKDFYEKGCPCCGPPFYFYDHE